MLYACLSSNSLPHRKGRIVITTKSADKPAAPEFPLGLDWLNVDRPLSMTDLKGKLVILDCWTYC